MTMTTRAMKKANTVAPAAMRTTPHMQDADAFYEQLLDAHQGLSREQSELLNARLILLLANQVGDSEVLSACVDAARESLE